MSGGNNSSFIIADPLAFLSKDTVWDINSNGIDDQQKPIYILDDKGVVFKPTKHVRVLPLSCNIF